MFVVGEAWSSSVVYNSHWWLWVPAPVRNCALGGDDNGGCRYPSTASAPFTASALSISVGLAHVVPDKRAQRARSGTHNHESSWCTKLEWQSCLQQTMMAMGPCVRRDDHRCGSCARPLRAYGRPVAYTSTVALSELSWMNSRRGSTTSPINLVKMSSASSTSLTFTCSSERSLVSSVVSQSWPGFISPRPL